MNDLPFGIDLSRYQYSSDGKQKPDFDKINATCDFVAVRAGISWGYADPWFKYSWDHIEKPRLAYHVVYPGEWASRQMAHFLDIVKPKEHDRLVLDMELDHGYSKARITGTLLDCLDFILANTGRYPIIYSRASWIDQFVDVSALPSNLDWWLAGYRKRLPAPLYTPEKTPPPALPKGVTNWLVHQTAERGNGGAVGVVSHYVDTNRWNGTKEQMLAYFGLAEMPEPPTPPEPEPPEEPEEPVKLFDARVVTTPPNRLRTRYTPAGKEHPEAHWLQSGAVVPVYEMHPTGWWRVGYQTWASAEWMQRLDYTPPASIIDIPPLCQKDPRWKDIKLGNSNLTIGSDGCLVTCFAMVLGVTPAEFNARMKAVGGFTGARIYWQMVKKAYPNSEYLKYLECYYTPAPLHEIDALLEQEVAVMAHVDYNPKTTFIDQHWVLIIGKNGDDYIINDPIDGVTGSFREKYGDPSRWIFRIAAYRRA